MRLELGSMISRSLSTRNGFAECLAGRLSRGVLVLTLAASVASGWAQTRLGTGVRLQYADMAALESGESRMDLSCQLKPEKPFLGFDLRFHAYYRVTVPIKVLADAGGWLQVIMRVTPSANSKQPVYLGHRSAVPDFPSGTRGEALLAGGFDLGLGSYQVDWMMRDVEGRVCTSHWKLEVKPAGSPDTPLRLGPNMVAERFEGPSDDEPPVERTSTQPLHVKILLNLSPPTPAESFLKPQYAAVLLSILRTIANDPLVSHVTLVAFNLREQKIIYRQDNADKIDFAALVKSLQTTTTGTVSYSNLQDRESERRFVTRLLIDHLSGRTASADAVIIVGPKVTVEKKVLLETLKEGGEARCPIFYLNYNPNPIDQPFADAIGSALKAYKGALAYNIVVPRDLGAAMRDMLFRMSKLANAQATVGAPAGTTSGAAFQQ